MVPPATIGATRGDTVTVTPGGRSAAPGSPVPGPAPPADLTMPVVQAASSRSSSETTTGREVESIVGILRREARTDGLPSGHRCAEG